MARVDTGDFYGDHVTSMLADDETLAGFSVASEQQSMFRGRAVLLVVTSRRLLVQPLNRRGHPVAAPLAVPPEAIESAQADGAGGGWPELSAAVMDRSAVKLKLGLRDGEKLRFTLMRGTGMLGALSGGETQREGVEALAGFLERAGE